MIVTLSLVLGVVIYFFMLMLSAWFEEPKLYAIKKAVIASAVTVFVNVLASKVPALIAVLLAFVMLALMGYMVYWWREEGSNFKELVVFTLIDFLMMMTANAAAVRIIDLKISWLTAIVTNLPIIMLVMSIGYFAADAIWFRESLEGGDQDEEEHGLGSNRSERSERSERRSEAVEA